MNVHILIDTFCIIKYNFHKMTSLFSNSGSEDLENVLFNSWLEGGEREDFGLGNFSLLLQRAAYSEPGS